jgi:hypothetical protein
VIEYWAGHHQLAYGKFVIPNPFGPLEEERLGAYLFKSWASDLVPEIKTPLYVRDNIPVDALAQVYCESLREVYEGPHKQFYFSPSGYVGSQKAFIEKVLNITNRLWSKHYKVGFLDQQDFSEPLIRVNKHPALFEYSEDLFWKSYLDYYVSLYK